MFIWRRASRHACRAVCRDPEYFSYKRTIYFLDNTIKITNSACLCVGYKLKTCTQTWVSRGNIQYVVSPERKNGYIFKLEYCN